MNSLKPSEPSLEDSVPSFEERHGVSEFVHRLMYHDDVILDVITFMNDNDLWNSENVETAISHLEGEDLDCLTLYMKNTNKMNLLHSI